MSAGRLSERASESETVVLPAVRQSTPDGTGAGRHRRGVQPTGPVFLDGTGRRKRRLKAALAVTGGAALIYTGVLAVSFFGGPGGHDLTIPRPDEKSPSTAASTSSAPLVSRSSAASAPATRPDTASPAPPFRRPSPSEPLKASSPRSTASPSDGVPDSPDSFWSRLFPTPSPG